MLGCIETGREEMGADEKGSGEKTWVRKRNKTIKQRWPDCEREGVKRERERESQERTLS